MTTNTSTEPGALWARAITTWMEGWSAAAGLSPAANSATTDSVRLWQRSVDEWLGAWAVFLEDLFQTPETVAASGRFLDATLNIEKPLRERTAAAMQFWLEFLNMPTRNDLIRLARQVNDANARLDDLQEQIETLQDKLA